MTRCAIGAATRPPVASPRPSWLSTITATATLGASAGAKRDQPGVRVVADGLRGAGLGADGDAGNLGAGGGAPAGDVDHHLL